MLVACLPDRDEEQDRLGLEPPADELQHLARRRVEPLGIVDEADQGTLGGSLREQAEHGETHDKSIRSVARLQPERDTQRLLLGLGQERRARSSIGAHSWCTAANGISSSDSTPAI